MQLTGVTLATVIHSAKHRPKFNMKNSLELLVPLVRTVVLAALCLVSLSTAQEAPSLQDTADLQEVDVPEWQLWMDKRRSDDNGGGNCTSNANCTNGEVRFALSSL